MASPFVNPFGGQGQRGAATTSSTTGRGQGMGPGRGSQFQPRGSSAPRGKFNPSRGRGASQFRGRGRGRGRGAGTTPTGAPHSGTPSPASDTSQSQPINSPFAQLNNNKPPPNPFGALHTQTKSPFASMQHESASQNNQAANAACSGLRTIPVEDATMQAQYHERYDQLKLDRAKQRQQAIKAGQMADPNQPTSLNKAITPVGTCNSMCPEFERVERIVQKMVDKSEKYLHPSTGTLQNMETKMLKRFRRSAAGYDEQLPSDIRTPNALLQSTNYLIRYIIGGNEELGIIHKFVWDRTRSIRNDFSVQQVTQEKDVKIAVTCLERIARFHIVSLHLLSSPANEEPFDRHQEREQLNNTMLSLMYYYDDNRGRIHFPNEDEFRAYYIIFSIHDQRPDLEARVSKWPTSLLTSPRVQVALELYAASCNTWEYQGTLDARRPNAISQGFYARFFNIVNSPSVSYLMACVAEIYFSYVRQTAIRAIWKGYCKTPLSQQHKNEEWTVDQLTRALHFDDEEQTIKFCEEQDLQLSENANGDLYLNWGNRPVDSIQFSPSSEHAYSHECVESKRTGRNLVSVILGMSVKEAARMGMIDKSELHERSAASERISVDKDDSLFVSAEGNLTPAPVVEPNTSTLEPDDVAVPSATSVFNPFQKHLPPTNTSFFGADQSTTPPNTSTPQPSNNIAKSPFTSMFSGNTSANNAKETTAAGSTSSPFANGSAQTPGSTPSQSIFSFSKPAELPAKTEQGSPSVFALPESTQSSSPSPFSGLFQPASGSGPTTTTPNPFTTPSSSLAAPPSSTPSTQAAAPAVTSNTNESTPLIPTAKSFFPSAAPNDPSPSETPAPQPSSLFPAARPLFSSTESTTISNAQGQPPKPSLFTAPGNASAASAPKPTSVFNFPSSAATTEPSVPTSAPVLNFGTPAQNSNSPSKFPSPTPTLQSEAKAPSPALGIVGDLNTANDSGQKSTFGGIFAGYKATKKASEDIKEPAESNKKPPGSSSLFGPTPTTTPPFTPPTFQPSKLFPTSSNAPEPVEESTKQPKIFFSQSKVSQSAEALDPLVKNSLLGDSTQSLGSAPPEATSATRQPGLGGSTASLDSSLSSRDSLTPSSKRKFSDGPTVYETEEEERAAWHRLLKRVEEKQARKKARQLEQQKRQREQELERELEQARNRKRALEEAASEQSAEEPEPKSLKVSDLVPNSPPRAKYSFAATYAEPLPTLPCLERVKDLTERKGPTDAEVKAAEQARRKMEVDQDEILLSAARIMAEQLKNGPKIFDGLHAEPTSEPRRYSYSPHRSLSSSTPYTQSMSPPEYPNHGYKVAYAPDTPLGLGRTLSRTEQRIRRTGAHGLAYIPLDFSKTYAKSSDDKNKFSQSQ